MFDIGFSELLVIMVVALLLFGAKRVPEVARAIGQSVNAFKNGLKEVARGVEETKAEAKPPLEGSDM